MSELSALTGSEGYGGRFDDMGKPYKDEDGIEYQYKPVNFYDSTDVGADELFMSPESQAAVRAFQNTWSEGDKAYKEAQAAGDQAGMEAAQKMMNDAHAGADGERAKYGYQGGANGGAYNPLAGTTPGQGTAGKADTFTIDSAPEYISKNQQIIDAALEQIRSRPAFSYDPETDPAYQQYKDQYTRQGKLAMEDTLGQVSARTGGLASSYAGSAAQQSYNQYMSALSDKIPELQRLAYEKYRAEGDDMRADLNMILNKEQMERSAFESDRGQFNTEQNFKYGLWSDQKDREYRADETAYQRTMDADKLAYDRGRDQADDQWRQTKWDYGVQQDALAREDQDRQEAVSRIDTYLQAGGAVDGIQPELLEQSGFSDVEINALAAYYAKLNSQSDQEFNAKMAANQAKGKSGGGTEDTESAAYTDVAKKAAKYDEPEEAKGYLERMVDSGAIRPEEAAYIYQVLLGGEPAEPEEEIQEAAGPWASQIAQGGLLTGGNPAMDIFKKKFK